MTRAYLAPYYDAELPDEPKLSIQLITNQQALRIMDALAVVLMAGSIPRRLGGDATSEDLALDKKRARRVGSALSQSLKGWSRARPTQIALTDEQRIEGAQLIWEVWVPAHMNRIEQERVRAVTWAMRAHEDRWAKSALTAFNNELKWVDYAMRD